MRHKFVEYIPHELEDDILYISLKYNLARHKCPCGCGSDIVTKLSPARWQLFYNGETVSLTPSIGNWNLDCKSHYFIKENQIIWAKPYSQNQIEIAKKSDQADLKKYINEKKKRSGNLDWFWNLFRK